MKIAVMGPQGCGKGTIGSLLSEKLQIPMLSVGDILRHLDENSPYYKTIHSAMTRGELAPNDITAKILEHVLSKPEFANGYILDGWMRQMTDIEFFDPHPDMIVVMYISRETSLKRLSGRRICEADGKNYNIYTLPPEELAKCPGKLIQREDDTPAAINKRLDIYYTETVKVIEFYAKRGIVVQISGEGSPNEVFAELLRKLKLK